VKKAVGKISWKNRFQFFSITDWIGKLGSTNGRQDGNRHISLIFLFSFLSADFFLFRGGAKSFEGFILQLLHTHQIMEKNYFVSNI
jgi:hypothetical protein